MSAADDLAFQLNACGMKYIREYVFDRPMDASKPRKWRFDFAWPEVRLACEVDGAIWTGGRHTRGAGVLKDCEKVSAAAGQGWRLVRVAPQHVASGEALKWIERALWWKVER